ncbi:type VI secretion system Vgr family protein [uncultured Alsobacter sp.]|uniref:type VI secretion system Vgr family protein n=1 Tax=uncultured Alsobacter sp. TaxID=1748258 RepID=UPI0025F13AEB|nr:type VI secretion system tip protein TssI/VgrG [uncultured Alsobacter sp.]
MAKPTQDYRVAKLETPLGKDELLLSQFKVNEALGEPFEIVLDCVSENKWLDFTPALGLNCSLTFKSFEKTRHFNGVLVEATAMGPYEDFFRYVVVLRPWFWLLTKRTTSRIFSTMKVQDIIKEVFQKAGQSDFEDKLQKDYPKLEYCVQYRESDFDFVSRLMELHGIYYYFKHTDSKHIMVLADDKGSHEATPIGTIEFHPDRGAVYHKKQYLSDWQGQRRFHTGKVSLNEYNPLKASASMKADQPGSASFAHSDYEHYEYPGQYDERGDGQSYAKVRMEMLAAQDGRRTAAGDAVTLMAGETVKVDKHYVSGQNTEYLILRSSHSFVSELFRSNAGSRAGRDVHSEFEFLETKTPFRSPFRTPKPRIFGVQTAKVVGKDGEEIDVDEHGRILLEFYWERDKKPSRRVRVAHVFAGKNWGGIHTPRIGMEAVVEFLEGDPDRPLVTGTVYNSDNKHPYPLPAEKTKSGLKTNSSKGGGGFNEFRFEDKKDSEEVYFHAQKDLNSVILHQETRKIAEKFGSGTARKTEIVNGDDDLKVANGNTKTDVSKNRETTIGMDDTLKVGKNQTITIGMDVEIKVGKSISLICGPNKITIDPGGIKIIGPTIALTAPKVDIN